MSNIIYLACAYSDPDPNVVKLRYEAACCCAAALARRGLIVYCPVASWHCVTSEHGLPTGWEYWRNADLAFIGISSALYVMVSNGWDRSVGVRDEIKEATILGLPVVFVDEDAGLVAQRQATPMKREAPGSSEK